MNRRQKIIVSITGIFIVLLALVGLTYAYFLTQITGNSNPKSISVTTANLELLYKDGNGILNANGVITPDTDITFKNSNNEVVDSKTFSVENKGNGKVNYAVTLEDLKIAYAQDSVIKVNGVDTPVEEGQITEFKYPNDFEITLTCEVIKGTGTCNGGTVLLTNNTNEIMLLNEIEVGAEHSYTLKMKYKDSGENQSEDMNKTFTALVNIIESKDTVDIEGTLTNTTGEELYIQTNSTKRISRVNKDGSYKIVGLEVGKHKLKACKVSDTNCISPILEKELNIERGTTAGVSGNTLTITEYSRLATINVNANTKTIEISNEIQESERPLTLGNAILARAKSITESDSKTLGYAMYSETLRTTPVTESSAADEALLLTTEDNLTATTNNPTYYFRGNVKDNFVNFAGMCWRVVRIDGNGNVKLILEDKDQLCDSKDTSGNYNMDGDWTLMYYVIYNIDDTQIFRTKSNNDISVFEEQLKTDITENHGNKTIDQFLSGGNWCLENQKYIEEGTYPNYTYTKVDNWSTYIDYYSFGYYEGAVSLGKKQLKCNGTIIDTWSDNSPMYVATLTADEVLYAGASSGANNEHLYLLNNNIIELIGGNGAAGMLTLSLEKYRGDGEIYNFILFANKVNGTYGVLYGDHAWTMYYRPAINIKSSVLYGSGIGTYDDPYEIK